MCCGGCDERTQSKLLLGLVLVAGTLRCASCDLRLWLPSTARSSMPSAPTLAAAAGNREEIVRLLTDSGPAAAAKTLRSASDTLHPDAVKILRSYELSDSGKAAYLSGDYERAADLWLQARAAWPNPVDAGELQRYRAVRRLAVGRLGGCRLGGCLDQGFEGLIACGLGASGQRV